MVNLNCTVADVIDTNIPHWAALTSVTTDAENGAYAPGVTTGTLTVTLHEDEDVRSWLTQEGATDPNDKLEGAYAEYSRRTVLGASMDGGKTWTPFETAGATSDKWVYWYFTYTPEAPGSYSLEVRSVAADGSVSPLSSIMNFDVV